MNTRHLLLTNLLVLTGCTHRSSPCQTSDFWSLRTITESDSLTTDATQPQVGCNTRKSAAHDEQPSLQEGRAAPFDGETACVLGL